MLNLVKYLQRHTKHITYQNYISSCKTSSPSLSCITVTTWHRRSTFRHSEFHLIKLQPNQDCTKIIIRVLLLFRVQDNAAVEICMSQLGKRYCRMQRETEIDCFGGFVGFFVGKCWQAENKEVASACGSYLFVFVRWMNSEQRSDIEKMPILLIG